MNFIKAALGTMGYGAVATFTSISIRKDALFGASMKYHLKALFYSKHLEEKY